jgi:hypothetical protein
MQSVRAIAAGDLLPLLADIVLVTLWVACIELVLSHRVDPRLGIFSCRVNTDPMSSNNTFNNKLIISIAMSLVLGAWTLPAYAYLDPGTGSMLIQGIIGAVAAVGVTLKLYWHKIKLLFGGHKSKDDASDESRGSASDD